jgi:hypothetical protein
MNLFRVLLVLIACCASTFAAAGVIHSRRANSDPRLDTNPMSSFWRGSEPIYMESDALGKTEPKYRTEIRTRWTKQNLYFLFVCPYEELNLTPNPNKSAETNELWNWDVAAAFIGADFKNIKRYKEFEISPQGEWIDLDIDLDRQHGDSGWKWNSNFEVSSRSIRLLTCGMGRCELRMRQSTVARRSPAILCESISFVVRDRPPVGTTLPGERRCATVSRFRNALAL